MYGKQNIENLYVIMLKHFMVTTFKSVSTLILLYNFVMLNTNGVTLVNSFSDKSDL